MSAVIAQRMNGSTTAPPPAAPCACSPAMSGIDATIATTPTTALATARVRRARNSSACAWSRAACASNAETSGAGRSAP